MLNEMSEKERQILYDLTYMWSLTKKKFIETKTNSVSLELGGLGGRVIG